MYAPSGYVSLAELWTEFQKKYRIKLCAIARKLYEAEEFSVLDAFGSPDDFCEDVFLEEISGMPVFAASANDEVTRLQTVLDGGRSKLFTKQSVLESILVTRRGEEAGPDGYWLKKMGTVHFEPHDELLHLKGYWQKKFPVLENPNDQPARELYHTLPIAFERARFVIPDEAPPWSKDLIDEHYLPKLIGGFGGRSLCLDAEGAKVWRVKRILQSRRFQKIGEARSPAKIGRPSKRKDARKAYAICFPNGHTCTQKEVCREIEAQTGLNISTITLKRALEEDQD